MSAPYSLLLIKPLTVGRGHAPEILQKILMDCPVSLRAFRAWNICKTTLDALYGEENYLSSIKSPYWICLFTHLDRYTDPTDLLNTYCGGEDPSTWQRRHLRYTYGPFSPHSFDTVMRISKPDRVDLEAKLLFLNFDEKDI